MSYLSEREVQALSQSFEVQRAFDYLEQTVDEAVKVEVIQAVVQAYQATRQERPAGRAVGRVGDMAPAGQSHMRVSLDSESDACVTIWDAARGPGRSASIEFCTRLGGGKSQHTRTALVALMVAMERDNAERPDGQYPPLPESKTVS